MKSRVGLSDEEKVINHTWSLREYNLMWKKTAYCMSLFAAIQFALKYLNQKQTVGYIDPCDYDDC